MNKNPIIDNFSIRWVVALKEEAKTIIDHYKLSVIDRKSVYPVFKNFDETHWLVLSGIGRHNAAAATAYLYSISKSSKSAAWINSGIAGCGKGTYGDLCLVDKISNNYGKNRYPMTMSRSALSKMHLFTSDIPTNNYSSQELIDMEGSAFYDIASKFTSNELICLMKVISDGPNNDIEDLNKFKIRELINLNIASIKTIVSYYEKLSMDQYQIIQQPKILSEILSQWHFSVSQKHQLENLIKRINTLSKDEEIIKLIKDCKNSRSVITNLEAKILNTKVDWSLV